MSNKKSSKFKVGDKVLIIATDKQLSRYACSDELHTGKVCLVEESVTDSYGTSLRIGTEGESCWVEPDMIKLTRQSMIA